MNGEQDFIFDGTKPAAIKILEEKKATAGIETRVYQHARDTQHGQSPAVFTRAMVMI